MGSVAASAPRRSGCLPASPWVWESWLSVQSNGDLMLQRVRDRPDALVSTRGRRSEASVGDDPSPDGCNCVDPIHPLYRPLRLGRVILDMAAGAGSGWPSC
jgi:hypothetical protein